MVGLTPWQFPWQFQNLIAITPSLRACGELSTDDICVVDCHLRQIEGNRAPSLKTPLHLAIYEHRLDVRAVIHTHSVFAAFLSVINEPIPPLFDEIVFELGATVEIVPYAISANPDLVDNVVGKLGNDCNGYLLQNQGALALGADIDQALQTRSSWKKSPRFIAML